MVQQLLHTFNVSAGLKLRSVQWILEGLRPMSYKINTISGSPRRGGDVRNVVICITVPISKSRMAQPNEVTCDDPSLLIPCTRGDHTCRCTLLLYLVASEPKREIVTEHVIAQKPYVSSETGHSKSNLPQSLANSAVIMHVKGVRIRNNVRVAVGG